MSTSNTARERWALAGWAALALGVRLAAIPRALGDVDGVNFARALTRFDPLAQAPHLPGYPVYVLCARLFAALGAPEVWALALPGVLASVAGILVLFAAVARHFGPRPAHLTAAALTALPGAVLAAGWPTSDGLGLGLLCVTLGLAGLAAPTPAARPRPVVAASAGLALGLLLGVRLSWWPLVAGAAPLVAAAALRRPGLRPVALAAAGGAALGLLAWAVPMALLVPPAALLSQGAAFAQGHFTDFGGAAPSASALPARLLTMLWGLVAATLGASWPAEPLAEPAALGVLALAAVAVGTAPRRLTPSLIGAPVVLGGYLVWVWLGQNVDKPRHLLPVVPALALGLGLALARTRIPALLVAAVLLAVSAPRAATQGGLPPAAALVRHVIRSHPPEGAQIFAGEEARLFERYAPAHRVWRVTDPAVLAREAAAAAARGATVLVVSGAAGWPALQAELTEEARFATPRTVQAHDPELVLYRYQPSPERLLHATR